MDMNNEDSVCFVGVCRLGNGQYNIVELRNFFEFLAKTSIFDFG